MWIENIQYSYVVGFLNKLPEQKKMISDLGFFFCESNT